MKVGEMAMVLHKLKSSAPESEHATKTTKRQQKAPKRLQKTHKDPQKT